MGTCASATAGRGESTGTHGVEDVEHERIFFRGEIEDPEDVDESEDEPSSRHGIQSGLGGSKNALVDANNGVDHGSNTEHSYLEAVHGDRVAGEGIEDAND